MTRDEIQDRNDLDAMGIIIESAISAYRGNATRALIDQFVYGLAERVIAKKLESGSVIEHKETTYTINC